MATGDAANMLARLRANLPPWFPQQGSAPVLDGALTGIAAGLSFVYSLIVFAQQQMRLATAQGGWIDFWAGDYFGGRLVRAAQQLDASWRAQISQELLRPRNTRQSVVDVLVNLTGQAPAIFEPSLPQDAGSYGSAFPLAYGLGGGYGSLLLPWTAQVGAFRPLTAGIPYMAGYGDPSGAYSQPSLLAYNDINSVLGTVTDAAIEAAVNAVRPIATVLAIGVSNVVTPTVLTDEAGDTLTDESGTPLYQD